jgi:hypothetical protein
MPVHENNQWMKDNIASFVSIILTVLTIAYFGIIKGNDDTNAIKANIESIREVKLQIQGLEDKKADKEILNMILLTLSGIQIDVREVRTTQQISKIKF